MRKPPPWPVTWMQLARTVANRSKDPSTQVGAVLVDFNERYLRQIGYNGPPNAIRDDGFDWADRDQKRLFVFHAESNCLWHAADAYGKDKLVGCRLYVTCRPCSRCTLEAVRAKLDEIVFDDTAVQPRLCDDEEWSKSITIAYNGDLTLTPYSKLHTGEQ